MRQNPTPTVKAIKGTTLFAEQSRAADKMLVYRLQVPIVTISVARQRASMSPMLAANEEIVGEIVGDHRNAACAPPRFSAKRIACLVGLSQEQFVRQRLQREPRFAMIADAHDAGAGCGLALSYAYTCVARSRGVWSGNTGRVHRPASCLKSIASVSRSQHKTARFPMDRALIVEGSFGAFMYVVARWATAAIAI
jgi:hypothetical protein